jgi:hypothetical protein
MDLLKILSIGSGKKESQEEINILHKIEKGFNYDTVARLFLDKSYFIPPSNKEESIYKFESYVNLLDCNTHEGVSYHPLPEEHFYSNCDVTEFMQRTKEKFDIVILNRVLEHIPRTEILYFIYLLSTITKPEQGIISIIVPDYKLLGQMIATELVESPNFDKYDVLVTSELLNEVSDPHASIWTAERLEHFFTY